jgi:hypothetical protein
MSLGSKVTHFLYDFLDIGKSPGTSDCIFVPAGRQEQRVYGIRMWRFGFASQIVLSIGEPEWHSFHELDLESDGGLESRMVQMPQKKRHCWVRLNHDRADCSPVQIGMLALRSEGRALARYLADLQVRSLLVVASPVQLRRIALIFRRAFRKTGIPLTFVAVPEKASFDAPEIRAAVWTEFLKYIFYKICAKVL